MDGMNHNTPKDWDSGNLGILLSSIPILNSFIATNLINHLVKRP